MFVVVVAVMLVLLRPVEAPAFDVARDAWRASAGRVLDRHGEVIDQRRVDFEVRRLRWVELEAVSPALVEAIVAGEDRRFWRHHGVDWLALPRAIWDRVVVGRRRGASTITMQLAAMLQPRTRAGRGEGAWGRKLSQVRLARGIEQSWDKRQILETYLNLLGFRGELQGIGAAAQVLAAKTPAGLSMRESLVLAALLPAPSASPERVAARACARAAARGLMVECGSLRATAAVLLNRAAVSRSSGMTPRLAPHVARMLLDTPGEDVQTTLDARLQRLAFEVLEHHLDGLNGRNVRDGAVLIVDNDTGEVLAYVGSAGPRSRASQVDGVRAQRQAGSTLKPFLYGLALEQRLLTAASLLDDAPVTLDTASGIYLPQNYDRDFKGLVSVRTSLASSLNVPAVRTLMLVGVEPFRDRLQQLGYAGITEDGEFYGYSLALGSAEVSLWEQVQAYRTLARGGLWSPLRLRQDVAVEERRVLPADASFVIANILSDRAARAPTFGLDSHLNTAFWSAVKTGTSKDMRDNWCIGFSSRFTVGVWVGNFEGDSMHDVSGITGAAPAWGELMATLHAGVESLVPSAPEGVTSAAIGFTPAVEAPRREWFLRGAALERTEALSGRQRLAAITSPANGMVIAVDPDIPPAHQRVPFVARNASRQAVFRLNGEPLGSARGGVLWAPQLGTYRLELVGPHGAVEDHISFTVR